MQALGQQQLCVHSRLPPILLLPVPRALWQPSRGRTASSTGPDPAEIQPGAGQGGQGAELVQCLPIRQPSLPPPSPLPEAPRTAVTNMQLFPATSAIRAPAVMGAPARSPRPASAHPWGTWAKPTSHLPLHPKYPTGEGSSWPGGSHSLFLE